MNFTAPVYDMAQKAQKAVSDAATAAQAHPLSLAHQRVQEAEGRADEAQRRLAGVVAILSVAGITAGALWIWKRTKK